MSEHIEAFKEWVHTVREDVQTLKAVVEAESVNREARKCAAAALAYFVTRMDLVPDWEESVGVLDDVMVLRMLIRLAGQYDVDQGLSGDTLVEVGRLTNEADKIEAFLGDELYARLHKHCAGLTDDAVRGRTPDMVVDDAEARAALFSEVDTELHRLPAAPFNDPEAVEVKFKSYLHHKLK